MHTPVLPEKVLECLAVQPADHVIDCTAGAGGHTKAILEQLGPKGKVLAIDWDAKAIRFLKTSIPKSASRNRLILREGNFADIEHIVQEEKFRPVHKILLDLGFSSDQLNRKRGLSFQKLEPLDMRYSEQNPITAEKIVNYRSRAELEDTLKKYGEERFAKHIAEAIVEARMQKPITTTSQLVDIVKAATPRSYHAKKIHPATKTFQALRIAANNELENLQEALRAAEQLVEPGGRIAVISFHSLEDRIVKQFFQQNSAFQPITKKPIEASTQEITNNPRARSAKLRVAEKQ